MAPPRNSNSSNVFPFEYSEAETDESEFDEAWLQALYSSGTDEEDEGGEGGEDEDGEIMEEEEAYMLGEDDETSLPPEAEKILYDYYAEQRQKAGSSPKSSCSKPTPVITEMPELEFDLDESRWGAVDIATPAASNSAFVVTPAFSSLSSTNNSNNSNGNGHNSNNNKDVPDLTPQVLAAICAATKQSHRIITIAEINQSDFSDDLADTLSLWSQLITDLDTSEGEEEEDNEDMEEEEEEEESEMEEDSEDYSIDSKEVIEDEWYRYKRIPINAFYKSRKGRRSSVTKQIVVPQGALRARGETVYLSACPAAYNNNNSNSNVLLKYGLGVGEERERAENEEEGLYWKSTLMDIY